MQLVLINHLYLITLIKNKFKKLLMDMNARGLHVPHFPSFFFKVKTIFRIKGQKQYNYKRLPNLKPK